MFIFTHIKIANYYYARMKKNIKKDKNSDGYTFIPDRLWFLYGSIKPDVSKMAGVKHHFEDTYGLYKEHLYIAQDESRSNRERSEALGVTIHFICDYFCKFHAKSPYKEKSLWQHFFYEFNLHLKIVMEIFQKNLLRKHELVNPLDHRKKILVSEFIKEEIEETVYMVSRDSSKVSKEDMDMIKMLLSYHTKEESTRIDTDFSFFVLNEIMSMVIGERVLTSIGELELQSFDESIEIGTQTEKTEERSVVA